MFTELPYSLTVDGEEKPIYTDFRNIILICNSFNDDELSKSEKLRIMLDLLYVDDWNTFFDTQEAVKQAIWFIDWGKEYKESDENSPRLMDWEQDYNLIVAAVNKNINAVDVRELEYMHWWTFLGYFSERGECRFSSVTDIRDKLNKGKKLEPHEKEMLRENRDEIILKSRTNQEIENELWGD